MVVAVFTTSCQVSEKPNSGPETAHKTISVQAAAKVSGRPARCETWWEKRTNGPGELMVPNKRAVVATGCAGRRGAGFDSNRRAV